MNGAQPSKKPSSALEMLHAAGRSTHMPAIATGNRVEDRRYVMEVQARRQAYAPYARRITAGKVRRCRQRSSIGGGRSHEAEASRYAAVAYAASEGISAKTQSGKPQAQCQHHKCRMVVHRADV
jgi:hypothetical protein